MITEKSINKIARWVQGLSAMSVTIAAFIAYVHSYVYPRAEAKILEKQVDVLSANTQTDLKELRQKIDSIYEILITIERRGKK